MGDALSKAVTDFFYISVIVLLVEREKRLVTVFDRMSLLNSSPFSSFS